MDHRYRISPMSQTVRLPGAWNGEPIEGQTLLVVAEGGFGDQIQALRFIPLLVERGIKVLLAVPPSTQRLAATLGVQLVTDPTGMPFDRHCPLPRIPPLLLGAGLPQPLYLRGDPASWMDFLPFLPGRKIGLWWAGLSRPEPFAAAIDARRSMRLDDMTALLACTGCSFVSLQMGQPASQMKPDMPIHNVALRLGDWLDTANLVADLDAVVSVDTAVVHLAGAMGKPVFMLDRYDPDPRWLTNWYPFVQPFRQTRPGDWSGPVQAVARELRKLTA